MRDSDSPSHRSNIKRCETCAATPPPDVGGAKPPPRKTDIREVLAVPVISDSDVLHIVDVTGVLFSYAITQAIKCSFPGNHTPHRSGLVAVTRCGETLRAGHDCAETQVIGWAEVNKTLRKLGRIEAQNLVIEAATGVYQRADARVRGLSPWIREAGELPAIGSILKRMHNAQDAIDAAGSPWVLSDIGRHRTLRLVEQLSQDAEILTLQLNTIADRGSVEAIEEQRRLWASELAPGVRDYFKGAQYEHRRRRR